MYVCSRFDGFSLFFLGASLALGLPLMMVMRSLLFFTADLKRLGKLASPRFAFNPLTEKLEWLHRVSWILCDAFLFC